MSDIKSLRIITSQGVGSYEIGIDGISKIEEVGVNPAGATAFNIYSGDNVCAHIETPFFEIRYNIMGVSE